MARPSSEPPLGISSNTLTGVVFPNGFPVPGRSPLATSPPAPPRLSKLSDSTPTVIPLPSTPKVERATSARIEISASLVTSPTLVIIIAGLANLRLSKSATEPIAAIGNIPET